MWYNYIRNNKNSNNILLYIVINEVVIVVKLLKKGVTKMSNFDKLRKFLQENDIELRAVLIFIKEYLKGNSNK